MQASQFVATNAKVVCYGNEYVFTYIFNACLLNSAMGVGT